MTFAWSYSKVKAYETCPRRHQEVDLLKRYKEAYSEQLKEGDEVHKAFAKSLTDSVPLPENLTQYQKWADRVLGGPGVLLVEQKYAITEAFEATTWFAKNVWMRSIADVVRVDGPVALALDWKTGNSRNVDVVQLMLLAQCIFIHYPDVRKVRAEFVWLKDDTTTPEIYDLADMADHWAEMYPRVAALVSAAQRDYYPPKPGHLCKRWCPVSSCEYHGK